MSDKKKKKTPPVRATPTTAVVEGSWRGELSEYLTRSRSLLTGLIMVMPLLILYQIGVLFTGGVRNGVDFVTTGMWWAAQGNVWGYVGINMVLVVLFGAGIYALRDRGMLPIKQWPVLMAESTVYAFFFGGAVIQLMSTLGLGALLAQGAGGIGEMTLVQKVVLSLGAGLYEEVVFRLIGVSAVYWGLRKLVGDLPSWVAAMIAVLSTSLIFSGIHYVGSLGDAFTLGSFLFRFFAGILLAAIFYIRGFAVAVYTHAIYDIIVMVFKS